MCVTYEIELYIRVQNLGQEHNECLLKYIVVMFFRRQRKEAERIEMLARNALNTSLEAKRLAEETLAMPDEADREIQMLRQK